MQDFGRGFFVNDLNALCTATVLTCQSCHMHRAEVAMSSALCPEALFDMSCPRYYLRYISSWIRAGKLKLPLNHRAQGVLRSCRYSVGCTPHAAVSGDGPRVGFWGIGA